jgi:hypothetical protein
MAQTNNIPHDPAARHRFEVAAAQSAAREWADKALELGQVGDTEAARYAISRAEASLVKMLSLEAQGARLENDKFPVARLPVQRRLSSGESREAQLNNAALLTWPRLRLRA